LKNNLKKLPELLAPAGSFAALEAAIAGGADAVYLGGTLFNARMQAKNFDRDELILAVKKCHEAGVRLYVTINTQIYDKEIASALEYVSFLWTAGVDALIIADIGLSKIIKDNIPDFELHASTQLSGHDIGATRVLKDLGFSRMVCARETTAENIRTLCEGSELEIEMFIHGAHCVAFSGQCLMSAMLGGRSGNRGQCAQPCRMKYNGEYPISLKDMALAEHIPEIIESGVASLKIEGRMKSPAYVYGVTSIYRKLLDENRAATKDEMNKLSNLFSRSGFTDGYYKDNISSAMKGIRSENDIMLSRNSSEKADMPSLRRDISPITVNDRAPVSIAKPNLRGECSKSKASFSARFKNADQVPKTNFFEHIYLPLEKFDGRVADGVLLPPIMYDGDEKRVIEKLEKAVSFGAKHAMVSNIGHFYLAEKFGLVPHGDFRLNIFNTLSARTLAERFNTESLLLSPELILPQIRDIDTAGAKKGAIVYGRIPLMLISVPLEKNELRDSRGARFPVMHGKDHSTIVNSVPIYMAEYPDRLSGAGISENHFIFTVESSAEVLQVIYAYQNKLPSKENVRRIQK